MCMWNTFSASEPASEYSLSISAFVESSFKTVKWEEIYLHHYRTFEETQTLLPTFLEDVYNAKRLQSPLDYAPPHEFELKYSMCYLFGSLDFLGYTRLPFVTTMYPATLITQSAMFNMFGLKEKFMPFSVDPNQFPIDLRGQLLLPGWSETTTAPDGSVVQKWTEENVFVRQPDGSVSVVSIHDLVAAYAGEDSEFAGLEFINIHNGRQMFFGLNPESVPGNQFSGLLYHERAGGGSNIVFVAEKPDGGYTASLLLQERPTQNQSGAEILQVPGGYPIEMSGTPDQIHHATAIAEGNTEVLGSKYRIAVDDSLVNLYSPYNGNNGFQITGKGQGIATLMCMIPFEILRKVAEGQYKLLRDDVEVADRKLERIFEETFYDLTPTLLKELQQPSDGYAACAKTCMAFTRVYMYLVLGI